MTYTLPGAFALEQRIMFDGAMVGDVVDATSDGDHAHEATPAPSETARKEVVIIDPSVKDYQTLAASAPASAEVLILGENATLQDIADLLAGRSDLDAIHLITHGDEGALILGGERIDSSNLNADTLALIGASLNENGDMMLYGCNVGADGEGQGFIDQVAQLTGADVAASDDLTGAESLGGDWDLEVNAGFVEATAISSDSYERVLAVPTVTGNPASVTVTEDTASNVDLSAMAFDDTDGDTLTVTLTASAGTFSTPADGAAVGAGVTETLVSATQITLVGAAADINTYLDTASNIKYTGAANVSGTAAATITVSANDGNSNDLASNPTINIDITAVNDAAPVLDNSKSPVLTKVAPGDQASAGDTVADIIVDGSITDGDGSAVEAIAITSVDNTNGIWQFSIDGGTTWSNISATTGQVVDLSAASLLLDSANKVRFVPDAGFSKQATFTFRAWDKSTGAVGDTPDTTNNGTTTAYSTATDTASVLVTKLVTGLGGADGLGETVLAKNGTAQTALTSGSLDDGYWKVDVSSVFDAGFKVGDTTYSGATDFYIGTNGYVTLGHGNTSFSGVDITTYNKGPLFAAFLTDIKLKASSTLNADWSNELNGVYVDTDTVNDIVTITYFDVGPYSDPTSFESREGNDIQIRLSDAGDGNFNIEYVYADVQWSGNASNYAVAGWTMGDGSTYGVVSGSGTTAVKDYDTTTPSKTWGVTGGVIEGAVVRDTETVDGSPTEAPADVADAPPRVDPLAISDDPVVSEKGTDGFGGDGLQTIIGADPVGDGLGTDGLRTVIGNDGAGDGLGSDGTRTFGIAGPPESGGFGGDAGGFAAAGFGGNGGFAAGLGGFDGAGFGGDAGGDFNLGSGFDAGLGAGDATDGPLGANGEELLGPDGQPLPQSIGEPQASLQPQGRTSFSQQMAQNGVDGQLQRHLQLLKAAKNLAA
ncbi:MAG: DUF4347 domain-containing protein [Methylocystaceae bacterium]|nr:DUF4347 domain-containing protein [Methylocystaceae bacterium]